MMKNVKSIIRARKKKKKNNTSDIKKKVYLQHKIRCYWKLVSRVEYF